MLMTVDAFGGMSMSIEGELDALDQQIEMARSREAA